VALRPTLSGGLPLSASHLVSISRGINSLLEVKNARDLEVEQQIAYRAATARKPHKFIMIQQARYGSKIL
jgi:hypothetical protein